MNRLLSKPGIWVAGALLLATSLPALYCLQQWYLQQFVVVFMAQVVIYAFAAGCVLRVKARDAAWERRTLIAILIVAGLLRAVALCSPQALSTDAFRYVWDGRVQAAGVNPYRYIPTDAALAGLRDVSIYPNINRAEYAHTIYPPAAQLVFLAAERISDSIMGMKMVMVGFEAVSIACLIALLRGFGMPETRVLLYAWHPLPMWEFAGTGHVDAVAVALLLLALLLAVRRAPLWAGIALAAATLVKYYPAIALASLYRRWDWRMPVGFAAAAVLVYLPYIGAGSAVLGFIPGYADEEGLRNGSGLYVWSLLQAKFAMPADALAFYLPIAAIIMAVAALWVQFGSGRRPADFTRAIGIMLLASVFTLLASPHNPWYFAWLVPFLCFRFSPAHVWLTGACALIYVLPGPISLTTQSWIYVPFLLLLLVQACAGDRFHTLETFDANSAHRHPTV